MPGNHRCIDPALSCGKTGTVGPAEAAHVRPCRVREELKTTQPVQRKWKFLHEAVDVINQIIYHYCWFAWPSATEQTVNVLYFPAALAGVET